MKRTLDAATEIEIELPEPSPAPDCLEEAVQLLLLAKHIRDEKPAPRSALTDYKPRERKKKGER